NNSSLTITYSDIEGGWTGTGNIDSDPLFCNANSSDYTLGENSLCVGTGENGTNMGAFGVGCDSLYANLVINEIMQNPSAVNDSEGEWFEIVNIGNYAADLENWVIKDNGIDTHTISSSLVIEPDDYLVFGNNSSSSTNGGVIVDYQYLDINLANGDDELILVDPNGVVFDSVAYDGGPDAGGTFPDPTGASMALQSPELDNNVSSNWTESTLQFGDGDYGTPGMPNYMSNIELDTSFVNFDTVNVNETATSTVVISNTGNDDLVVDSISVYSGGGSGRYSLSFDGDDDKITITNSSSVTINDYLSIQAWIKISTTPGQQKLIGKGAGVNYAGDYLLGTTGDGKISAIINTSNNGWAGVVGSTNLPLNEWTHVSFTYDGSIIMLFLNGILDGSNPLSGTIQTSDNDLIIGSADDGGDYFSGLMDEAGIWNTALTQSQI
ncbi:uncharacterized protein METZ01_LOCUS265522, partial [marine metagenome]